MPIFQQTTPKLNALPTFSLSYQQGICYLPHPLFLPKISANNGYYYPANLKPISNEKG